MKNGQATLEFSLVLIVAIALIAGLYRLARWVPGHIPNRQATYDQTRINAGQRDQPGSPEYVYQASVFSDSFDIYYLRK